MTKSHLGFGRPSPSERHPPPGPGTSSKYPSGPVRLILCLLLPACAPDSEPGPFEQVEQQVWRIVNRSHTGSDGIFVQATMRTFAYEIVSLYARAEQESLDQEQLLSRFREFIYQYVDGHYPFQDGTDINSLYYQYLVYVNRSFDASNPIEKKVFDNWRSEYVRRLLGEVYDHKYPLLRNNYDQRWGPTLYSRFVFYIYLDNSESDLSPRIDDIGSRVFLIDEEGNRYSPSGQAGPYPYEFDRPKKPILEGKVVFRLFFPNRKADRRTPIVDAGTRHLDLVIENLGEEPERRLRWELPFDYPQPPSTTLGDAVGTRP